MKKYFKIGDLFIFIAVIILVLSIFFFVFRKYNHKSEDANIQIMYKNEVIDVIQCKEIFQEDKEYIYVINGIDDKIYIYKNDVLFKTIDNKNNNDFNNVIKMKDNKIYMEEASCKNKDCMKTIITSNSNLPIICTNGISIVISNESSDIDIIAQ